MGCCGSKDKYNGDSGNGLSQAPTNQNVQQRDNGKSSMPPVNKKNNTIKRGKPQKASEEINPSSLYLITDLGLKNEIQQGLEDDPNDSDLLAQYGILLSLENKNKEAEASLRKAVDTDKDNSRTWQAFGEFLERTNNVKKAKEIYAEGYRYASPKIALDLDDCNFLLSYAICLQKSGDIEKAEKLYKKIVTSGAPTSDSLGRYGLFQLEIKKDIEKAGQLLQSAADIDPPSPEWCTRYSNYLKTYKKDEFEAAKYQKRVSLYVN